jgi:hypothetical protein
MRFCRPFLYAESGSEMVINTAWIIVFGIENVIVA